MGRNVGPRAERSGGETYESAGDRDKAVESSYRLSPTILALLGDKPDSVVAAVSSEQVAMAELFHRENPRGASLEERVDNWSATHFGRRLESAARGILLYAVKRTLQFGDGGRVGPVGSIYRDFGDQRSWERATMAHPRQPGDGGWEKRAGRIARAVTGDVAEGPPTMPRRRKGGVSL